MKLVFSVIVELNYFRKRPNYIFWIEISWRMRPHSDHTECQRKYRYEDGRGQNFEKIFSTLKMERSL